MASFHFFTRHGGVSGDSFASLNVSHGTGDDSRNIEKNRAIIKHRVETERLLSAHQIHSDRVYVDTGEVDHSEEVEGFDALITNRPGTALMIQQADCQAVLLHDPVEGVIGAIHNGWRGSVVNIIGATIEQMVQSFGTDPENLRACISPSLGPCCAEFTNYRNELPEEFHRFQVTPNYFDFWQISTTQLTTAGVRVEAIRPSDICTSCSKDYFSYRRAVREGNPVCGRHASVIALATDLQKVGE